MAGSMKGQLALDAGETVCFALRRTGGKQSIPLPRGMKGTYQHCAEKHLHRYLNEFDFRCSNRVALGVNDLDRAEVR
ncbi:hypothetical protein XH88_16950 [Bradyrhizobium sp. CCBAU 51627]|nr:hypothetical protein [Bradyrhizobium sp. CCBAU 51627]